MSDLLKPEDQKKMIMTVEKDKFAEFLSSLLGKPQTITQLITGKFELELHHFINIYDLIQQRVHQQNNANLLQFELKIIYSDNSTRLINSRDELETYTDYRDVIPESLHMRFIYLIRFNDPNNIGKLKKPEKQEIEISYVTRGIHKIRKIEPDTEVLFGSTMNGYFETVIKHTAITWGADIESLLKNHINSLKMEENKFRKILISNSGKISILLGLMFFFVSVGGIFLAIQKNQETKFNEYLRYVEKNKVSNIDVVSDKLDYIVKEILDPSRANRSFTLTLSIILISIITIFIMVWIEASANINERSYLLLNPESFKMKKKIQKKKDKKFASFIISIVLALILNIISSYIFNIIFNG